MINVRFSEDDDDDNQDRNGWVDLKERGQPDIALKRMAWMDQRIRK